jgi:hypothetical protein
MPIARDLQRTNVGARVDVVEAAVLDNGVRHTGVVEHSAHHHVLVVVLRRLVTTPWNGPMFIFPQTDVATHSARSRDIVIAMPSQANLDEVPFFEVAGTVHSSL